jgi:hypothetical protein
MPVGPDGKCPVLYHPRPFTTGVRNADMSRGGTAIRSQIYGDVCPEPDSGNRAGTTAVFLPSAPVDTSGSGAASVAAKRHQRPPAYSLLLSIRSISYSASRIAAARLTGLIPVLLLPSPNLNSHRHPLPSVS